jgi:Zn-dependent M28 family amino/carboxypeptidase
VVDLGEPGIDENLIYLVAHYDSVARSHGATDNAAGTACVLELIDKFSRQQPKRRLRAVLFSGEELGLLGSFAHVAMHEEEIRSRGRFVLNLDVAGDPIGRDTLHVLGTREMAGYVGGIAREAGWALSEKLGVYSSDNVPFAVHEVPSVSIARGSGGGSYFIHTEDDVAKHVAPPGLDGPFYAGLTVLTRVLGAEVFPLKREIDDNLKDKLEKYLYRVRVEKPELKWRESYKRA